MKIWKYRLAVVPVQKIELPIRADIIAAQNQNNELYIWVIVNPSNPQSIKEIHIVGTGFEFDDQKLIYIDTVQIGNLVWHVFEKHG